MIRINLYYLLQRFVVLLFFIVIIQGRIFAAHVSGADITYQCLDANGNYKVTLVYYMQCGSIPTCSGNCADLSSCLKTITVSGGDPFNQGTTFAMVSLYGVSVRDVHANAACPDSKTICDNLGCVTAGSYSPGMERYEFTGTVNLGPSSGIPSNCCQVVLSFTECCRSTGLQNISSSVFYTETMLNRCAATYPNCNSIRFSDDPWMVVCYQQLQQFSPMAWDPDYDSLSYELVAPKLSYAMDAGISAPYSISAPLPWTGNVTDPLPGGFHFDPITGKMAFLPPFYPFMGAVALKVRQWRVLNGKTVLVGYTIREYTTMITYCQPNHTPIIQTQPIGTGIQGQTRFTVCKDSMICINVIATDSDATDTTYLMFDSTALTKGISIVPNYTPGTRQVNGPREDHYIICWKAEEVMADHEYSVTYTASDRRCQISGVSTQTLTFRTIGVQPEIEGDTIAVKRTWRTYHTPYHPNNSWTWHTEGALTSYIYNNNIDILWDNGDTGIVSVIETGCQTRYDTLQVLLTKPNGLTEHLLPGLELYPQPAHQLLYFKGAQLHEANILDSEGRLVRTYEKSDLTHGVLSIQGIPPGTYFLSVKNERQVRGVHRVMIY